MADINTRIIVSAKDEATSTFKKVSTEAQSLASRLTSIQGIAMGGLAAFGFGSAITDTIAETAKFETALTDMGKVTERAFDDLKADIMSLPPELGTATELMQGYYQVMSAGVTEPTEAIDMLVASSKAAKGAHVSQAEVIKALSKVMAGYAGEVETAAEAADLLFGIEKVGQTSVAELVPYIGSLAALSREAGLSANELGAALAQVTQTAGSTSDASTQLKAVLMGLYKPTENMTKLLSSMGYDSGSELMNSRGLVAGLQDIYAAAEKANIPISKLFDSSEALIGLSALSASGFSGVSQKLDDMAKTVGMSEKAYNEFKGTLEGLWETSQNTVGYFALTFGNEWAPSIKDAVEDTQSWLMGHDADIAAWGKASGEGLATLSTSLRGVVDVYSSMPDSGSDMLEAGIVGRMVFGSWGPAKIVAAIVGLSSAMEELNQSFDIELPSFSHLWRTIEDAQDAFANIFGVMSGDLDWQTGEKVQQDSELEALKKELASQQKLQKTNFKGDSGWNAAQSNIDRLEAQIAELEKQLAFSQYGSNAADLAAAEANYIQPSAKPTQSLDTSSLLGAEFDKPLEIDAKALTTLDNALLALTATDREQRLATLRTQYQALADTIGENNPKVIALGEAIATIEQTGYAPNELAEQQARLAEGFASSRASLERELQKFSLSDQDFQEWDLVNTTLPQLMEKTGNATELVNAYAEAQRAAWNDAAVQAAMQEQAEAMRQQQDLYSSLAELSGDWATALQIQNDAIEQEANKLREAMPELAAYIDEWERLSKAKNDEAAAAKARTADYDARMEELNKDEYYTDHVAGIEQAWLEATQGLDNYRDQMKETFTDAFSTIKESGVDALTELFTTGKLEVDSFFANLASQIATMAAQAAANSLISGIFSALSSSFSYGTSSATSGAVSSIVASVFHDGGVVGAGGTSSYVPASVFANAKRYHTGGFLAADEVPVIAQTGENILSRSDSGNLGGKLDKIANLLTSQNSGTSTTSGGNTNVVLVDDNRKVKDYLLSAEGSKTFTTMLNNNRQSIKNVANGGRA